MELNIYDKYLTINQTNTTKDLYSNCFGLRKQIIMPNYGRNSSLDLRDVKSSPYSHSQEDGRIEKQQSSFTDLKTKNTSVVDTIFGFGALPCSENLAKPFSTYKKTLKILTTHHLKNTLQKNRLHHYLNYFYDSQKTFPNNIGQRYSKKLFV